MKMLVIIFENISTQKTNFNIFAIFFQRASGAPRVGCPILGRLRWQARGTHSGAQVDRGEAVVATAKEFFLILTLFNLFF
jgi:hypothetical protein